MTIRPVEPSDEPAWLAMRLALWPDGPAEDHLEEMREYSGLNPSFATFLAMDGDGRPCGFLEASLRPHADGCRSRPVGYVEGIFVDPVIRGRGIGRALVAAAGRWALSHGCSEMASDCLHDNEASIRFHERLGFEVAERLIHFRRPLP